MKTLVNLVAIAAFSYGAVAVTAATFDTSEKAVSVLETNTRLRVQDEQAPPPAEQAPAPAKPAPPVAEQVPAPVEEAPPAAEQVPTPVEEAPPAVEPAIIDPVAIPEPAMIAPQAIAPQEYGVAPQEYGVAPSVVISPAPYFPPPVSNGCSTCCQPKCCCPPPQPVSAVYCLVDPCGCSHEACITVPACCAGQQPNVSWRNGILGRQIATVCWDCCDHAVKVVVTRRGKVKVRG